MDPVSDAVQRLARSLEQAVPDLAPLVRQHAFAAVSEALQQHGGQRHYVPMRPPLEMRTQFLGLQLQQGKPIHEAFRAAQFRRTSGYAALQRKAK